MARRNLHPLATLGASASHDMAHWRGLTRPTYMPYMGIGTEPAPQPLPVPRPVQQPTRIMGLTRTQMILVVVVLLVLLYAAYRAGKANSPSPMQAVRKMSTNRLSKALYERLERNGRASDRTRAALAQLGR